MRDHGRSSNDERTRCASVQSVSDKIWVGWLVGWLQMRLELHTNQPLQANDIT
jgi:hypothetical protein